MWPGRATLILPEARMADVQVQQTPPSRGGANWAWAIVVLALIALVAWFLMGRGGGGGGGGGGAAPSGQAAPPSGGAAGGAGGAAGGGGAPKP